jgi:small-conductance mechanosensitive channel
MNEPFSIQGAVMQVLQKLGQDAIAWAPRLVTAMVLALIGWLIARLLQILVSQVLHRAGVDAALDRAGLLDSFRRLGIHEPGRRFVPSVLFWLTLLIFLQSGAEMVGLVQIAAGITAFFAFLPNLFSAALVLLLGNALGQFLARAVTAYARESGLAFARSLGNFVSGFVLFVVVIVALGQLRVDTRILNILTIVIFSGAALGFGLTFGLGTRDTTRNLVAGFYARRLFAAGERLTIAGQTGRLRAISAMQTLLEHEGRTVAVPNSTFLEQVVGRDDSALPPSRS